MLKSSDNGETWSEPKDITGSILNPNDGVFFAVAPGSGLTTSKGRIIMPIYTFKGTVVIYSDDNGETWQRNSKVQYTSNIDEWTAVEAPSGEIYSFGRARLFGKTPVSVSKDNGIIWNKSKKAKVKAPRCQKNSIVVGDKVYISHPSGKKREKGVISVGKFEFDKKNNFKGIKWLKNDIKLNDDFFAYSCMAKIDENTIGIIYEDQPSSHIIFDTIKV
jgi:sialidase-1